ncbi:hypothetical protein CDAR_587341 [Caerostris darwini]|uniref:Uncharacterized protein n=1 Tax=Caerostris darwini TaxID=1538125 RepID=A0AAV4SLS1_9ARAC|nr:hypothetical protein CDAR_587341 [Caerostris darwini]
MTRKNRVPELASNGVNDNLSYSPMVVKNGLLTAKQEEEQRGKIGYQNWHLTKFNNNVYISGRTVPPSMRTQSHTLGERTRKNRLPELASNEVEANLSCSPMAVVKGALTAEQKVNPKSFLNDAIARGHLVLFFHYL